MAFDPLYTQLGAQFVSANSHTAPSKPRQERWGVRTTETGWLSHMAAYRAPCFHLFIYSVSEKNLS